MDMRTIKRGGAAGAPAPEGLLARRGRGRPRRRFTNWAAGLSLLCLAVSAVLLCVHGLQHGGDSLRLSLRELTAAGSAPSPAPGPSSAFLLYVSSYAGTVTTFNVSVHRPAVGGATNGTTASIEAVASTKGCAPSPSWLTLDHHSSTLYCLDEGLTSPNGSVSSFRTVEDGTLVQLDRIETLSGPVSAAIYGAGGRGLAIAQYSGSSASTFSISDPSDLALLQAETFTLAAPGADPSRQEAPHPHEAIVDPTGRFLLVPDLGADLVRVFAIDRDSLRLTATAPLAVAPGTGPRHGAFLTTPAGKTFFYLVGELACSLTGYEVRYAAAGLAFTQVYATTTYHDNATAPDGVAAAEIQLSPDSRFLLVSSRGDADLPMPALNGTGAVVESDPLLSYAVDARTGRLALAQRVAAGGSYPRHFAVNRAGTLVAVGLQRDGRLALLGREPASGRLTGIVGWAEVGGEVTCVAFAEQ